MLSPEEIIKDRMLLKDAYSQWLGVELVELGLGYVKIKMKLREEMLNGFKIGHGGVSFGFADSALAFASNSHGKLAYSINTSINHLKKVQLGDELFAEAEEEFYDGKLGKYKVTVTNQKNDTIAIFSGMVYVTKKDWV